MTAQFKPRNLLEYYRAEAQERKEADAPKTLREVKSRDQSGRTITEFEGSPSAWMQDFGMAPKKLISINTR